MKCFSSILLFVLLQACNDNHAKPVVKEEGFPPCEGCEAIYESPVPLKDLNSRDTLADYFSEARRSLLIEGRVLRDGRPVPGVVIYAYHTNDEGVYPTRNNSTGWELRHGYIRGWVRTGGDGKYAFLTKRPAPYPGRKDPAHIHFIILEDGKSSTWIDDVHFDDDPLLNADMRSRQRNRGGGGIVKLKEEGGLFTGMRDILLDKL